MGNLFKSYILLVFCTLALNGTSQPIVPYFLTTSYNSTNCGKGDMFDIEVIGLDTVVITSFDINMELTLTTEISVYYKTGSHIGFETNASAWTLLGTQTVSSNGNDHPTPLNVGNIILDPGKTYGFYFTGPANGSSFVINSIWTPTHITYSDANLSIATGIGFDNGFFSGPVYQDFTWSGTVYYELPCPHHIPLGNWSIYLGLILIVAFSVYRFRRIFF